MSKSSITLFVNGKQYRLNEGAVDPRMTLITFLRNQGLTGTKLGCAEGGCGACTIMISRFNKITQSIEHLSANACLTPLCSLDGCAVTTVEGIGGMRQGLHPVQKRIATMHGSQCGFCTPGIVMAIYTQLRRKPDSTPHEIEESLDGNLCRCTGYRPILDAARSLSNNKGCGKGEKCCGGGCGGAEPAAAEEKKQSGCCGGGACGKTDVSSSSVSVSCSEKVIAEKPSLAEEMALTNFTEPIFPPALVRFAHSDVAIHGEFASWFQPLTLARLTALKREHPAARIVVGNTEVGIEVKFKGCAYTHLINPVHVPELQELRFVESHGEGEGEGESGVVIGGAVTMNRLRDFLAELVERLRADNATAHAASSFSAVQQMLTWFASNHIRNVASVAGNIVTASPISDMNPLLCACRATITLVSHGEGETETETERTLPLDKFFLAYRKVDMLPSEVVKSVFLPCSRRGEFVLPFKQARRREDDISIVTAGYRFLLDKTGSSHVIRDCALFLGGMAPTTVSASKTRDALRGELWGYAATEKAMRVMREELALPERVPGGQAEFRTALCLSFLMKAFLSISAHDLPRSESERENDDNDDGVPQRERSGAKNFVTSEKTPTRGEQLYVKRRPGEGLQRARPVPHAPVEQETERETETETKAPKDAQRDLPSRLQVVGESVMHKSAAAQTCGDAKYAWDTPLPAGATHAALVLSDRAKGRVRAINATPAETLPGFVAFFDKADVLGHNLIGAIVHDEEVFVSENVPHFNAVLGVVVAETHEQALLAAKAVRVEYEEEEKNEKVAAVVSIEDAIAAKSFHEIHHEVCAGDVSAGRAASAFTARGTVRIGGQEHFYLETHCAVAAPQDNGFLEVVSSTQNVNEVQKLCAEVCALPVSQVSVVCKRMGGGFGGKESRASFVACIASICAVRLQRCVSLNIERDLDMSITGQRHAFLVQYEAGCDAQGTLTFLEAELFNNAGFSLDLSSSIMDRAIFHSDNVYRWNNVRLRGNVCRTHQPSHTAFRGFGGPQGLFFCETAMQHLSSVSGIPVSTLRGRNLYAEGDRTHFHQKIEDFFVPKLWEDIHEVAEVAKRGSAVKEFNAAHRWRKRGLSVLPVKFGINFTAKFLNQGGALVHVHTDGSVLVAHGGTEMGQGLFTKVIQVAAQAFNIPDSLVFTAETSTKTVANASATAASLGSDLYGMAVLDACEQIVERLKPIRARLPADASWESVVRAAYFDRVNLSAQGFYVVDGERCGYDWENPDYTQRGTPFNYFTQGVACSEVEIDCLTGDHHVVRTDILMDVGKSINPAIDIGQIEGAFVQGQGWCTLEELVWGDKEHPWVREGQLFTRGPGTYKIPAFNDIPQDFRVHLADTHNRFAVHSSKAVGEPPLFLGATVFFAIKNAVDAARQENGLTEYYQLDSPATSERIRMACGDSIATMCIADRQNSADYHAKGSW